jgi:uncharacterized phage protein (TIGR02220 family)
MGDSYSKVWVVVFAYLDEETSYGMLAKLSNVSKSQTYRIIQWGTYVLEDLGVQYALIAKNNSIVISIGKNVQTLVKAEEPKPKSIDKNSELIKHIIEYLNQQTNRSYTNKAKDAVRAINARISEGHKLEDFKKVIDIKTKQWMGTEFENYLRPITLFGTKFNSYINERPTETNNQSAIARTIATANKVADELGGVYEE